MSNVRAQMHVLASLLPGTALVAVIIFVLKELLEAWRRRAAEGRRKKALKDLLARECELNHWAIRALQSIVEDLNAVPNPESISAFRIEYAKSGRIYACFDPDAGGNYSKMAVPLVHREQVTKHLLEIATIDKKLFSLVEPALTAIAELEHVRESLLYHGSVDEGDIARDHIEGFAEYASTEIEEARSALASLYRGCTGKELNEMRLR